MASSVPAMSYQTPLMWSGRWRRKVQEEEEMVFFVCFAVHRLTVYRVLPRCKTSHHISFTFTFTFTVIHAAAAAVQLRPGPSGAEPHRGVEGNRTRCQWQCQCQYHDCTVLYSTSLVSMSVSLQCTMNQTRHVNVDQTFAPRPAQNRYRDTPFALNL